MNTKKIVALVALVAFTALAWGSFRDLPEHQHKTKQEQLKKGLIQAARNGNLGAMITNLRSGADLADLSECDFCGICKKCESGCTNIQE